MDRLVSRVLWIVLPMLGVLTILALAVWGENGLIRHRELETDLAKVERRLAVITEENAALAREVSRLRDDDPTRRRAAAEELLLVPENSTVYRFPAGTP
ncbi:MAG: septum formation initiator family protein [Deltaproteobacteria bacterium]|nr:septum formation initiator family protein [Deltaproteobacteria bacterium]